MEDYAGLNLCSIKNLSARVEEFLRPVASARHVRYAA